MNQGLGYEIAQVMTLATATGLFLSSASFVKPNPAQGATGNSIGGYLAIAGLQSIPCMDAPENSGPTRPSTGQQRMEARIESDRQRHVLLGGYYPQLNTGFASGAGLGWQVSIDGTMYTFLGGESDSQQTQTRIKCELVTG